MPATQRVIIKKIARNLGAEQNANKDIGDLLSAVQIVFNCTLDDLKSNNKHNDLPYARRIFFYYADKIFSRNGKHSKRRAGGLLSRNKSDVSYNIKEFKRQNDIKYNYVFCQYVQRVKELLDFRWFVSPESRAKARERTPEYSSRH
jgi:chromosomal replication initiation ATPase DnaA